MEQNLIELLDNKLGMDYSAQLYLNNLMYNEYLDIIKEIVEEFNKNGICYCILKGFSIIDSLYKVKDSIYRKFSDVDILVEKKDVSIINIILNSIGFIQGKITSSGGIAKASRRDILYLSLNSHPMSVS